MHRYRRLGLVAVELLALALVSSLLCSCAISGRTASRAGHAAVINVRDYGAVGNGATDDTVSIQAALSASKVSGQPVYFPPGTYRAIGVRVQHPVHIFGAGMSSVLLAGGSGPLLLLERAKELNDEAHLQGVIVEKIRLMGDRRRPAASGIRCIGNDHFKLADLWIEDFAHEALDFYTTCREGVISNVHTRYCGTKELDRPAVRVVEQSPTTDSINNLQFQNCFFNFSLGDSVVVDTVVGAKRPTAMISFNNCMIHGIEPNAVRFTPTAAQLRSTLVRVGRANQVALQAGTRLTSAGFDTPSLHLAAAIGGEPDVVLANVRITEHVHPSGQTKHQMKNPGVQVDAGRLTVLGGAYLAGHTPAYRVSAGGAIVNPGAMTVLNGTKPVIDGRIISSVPSVPSRTSSSDD